MRIRTLVLLGALLLLAGCQLTLISFTVPATAQVGQVLEIEVEFSANSVGGEGGAVLQLPNGFTVISAIPHRQAVRDNPALLAAFTAEPGHYLASWSLGFVSDPSTVRHSVFLRAPGTAMLATIKLALAGRSSPNWQANSPVGVTDFAQITTSPNAQTIAIVSQPTTDYAIDATGLPYPAIQPAYYYGIALHDFDLDGNDDLATTERAFLRTGAGWAEGSLGLTPARRPERIAAGDFDGDGFQDLVQGGGQVFFGSGGGSWVPGPRLLGAVSTFGVAAGDVNGDGFDDIALGGYDMHLSVYLGNANRTFTSSNAGLPALPVVGGGEVLLRDVTGDGNLDLVWTEIWAGNGQGGWNLGPGMIPNVANGVDAGDLDGDGLPEVVYANNSAGVAIYRHLGGNSWIVAQTIAPFLRRISSVVVLDYDRDGNNDLALGYQDSANGIEIWRNLGGLTFAPMSGTGLPASTPTFVEDLAVGDINGDTFPDLAVAYSWHGIAVYQNWRSGVSSFGEACGNATLPSLAVAASGLPQVGNASFSLQLGGGQTGTAAVLWIGSSST
ncbi:MAG: VCBS repeat-containing protein, partial [Planctomycetota bacterium]